MSKLIFYKDDNTVLSVLEEVTSVSKEGDGEILHIEIGDMEEHMEGINCNYILLPNDAEISDTLTQEIIDQGIPIEQVKSEKEQSEEIKNQLENAVRILNEMSRQFIKSDALSDEQKSELIGQFRNVKVGDTVNPNEVVRIKGSLYRMVQPSPITIHDESWLEDESLFTDFINPVLQEDGEDQVVVDDYVQPTGAHDAYNTGDAVLFNGEIYIALQDGLIWSPADYPQGWELSE